MPLTADLEQLAARVSNWGRWGADDQRGTLNLVTTAAVQRGVAAARHGRVFSLAVPFDQTGPQWDNVHMPERTNPELRTHTVNVAFTGDSRDFTTSDDSFRMGSQAVTHWDAIAHVGYDGKLYNDVPNNVVRAEGGAARLGIEHFGPVATRGVLLDIRGSMASSTSTTRTPSPAPISTPRQTRRASRSNRGTRSSYAPGKCTFSGPATSSVTRCRRPDCRPSRSNGCVITTWPRSPPTR